MGVFLNKYIVKQKKILEFFEGVGRGRGSFFYYIKIFKATSPLQPCAILYLFKYRVANLTPLNKFFKNPIKIIKKFGNFFIFREWEGVGVILFIPKHKVQLLPSKVCAILYLLKEGVANPHPLK